MPRFARFAPSVSAARRAPIAGAAFASVLVAGSLGLALALGSGCSHHEADAEADAGAHVDAGPVVVLPELDAANASDGRLEAERAALLDAGRTCGSKELPDCPLQGWMKRNAKTLISFGDISSIAEAFDRIARFAPTNTAEDGGLAYPLWTSIARDGAAAARAGDLEAAKGACRGCHNQYRSTYHAWMRGRALPPDRDLPGLGEPVDP